MNRPHLRASRRLPRLTDNAPGYGSDETSSMSQSIKNVVIIGLIVLALVVGLGIGFWPDRQLAKRTATAPAQITNTVPTSVPMGRGHSQSGYHVYYRFRVNDEWVEGVSRKNPFYYPGEACRVCFEPGNPTNSDLRDASSVALGVEAHSSPGSISTANLPGGLVSRKQGRHESSA